MGQFETSLRYILDRVSNSFLRNEEKWKEISNFLSFLVVFNQISFLMMETLTFVFSNKIKLFNKSFRIKKVEIALLIRTTSLSAILMTDTRKLENS